MNRIITFEENSKGKDYVVGDIHGHYDLLMNSLYEIGFNEEIDRLFSVGDLIDRGENSLECLSLVFKPWFFAVRGNHEQMMFDALIKKEHGARYLWLYNGGDWILNEREEVLLDIVKNVEQLMPYGFEIIKSTQKIGIIHAEPPSCWLDIGSCDERRLIWSREKISRQNTSYIEGIDIVYVGHTPVKSPVTLGNVRYIDTGAFHTGRLTIEQL